MSQTPPAGPELVRPKPLTDAMRWRLVRLVDLLVEIAGNEPPAELTAREQETAGNNPAASGEAA